MLIDVIYNRLVSPWPIYVINTLGVIKIIDVSIDVRYTQFKEIFVLKINISC